MVSKPVLVGALIPLLLALLSIAPAIVVGDYNGIVVDWIKNYGEDSIKSVYLSSYDNSLFILFENKLVKYTVTSERLQEQWTLNRGFENAVFGEMNFMNTPCLIVASGKNITLINENTGAITGTITLDEYLQGSDTITRVSGGDDLIGVVTENGRAMAVWINAPDLSMEGAYTVMTTNLTSITLVSVNTWDPEGEVLVTFANETSVFTYNVTSSQTLSLKWSRTLNPTVSSVLWNPSGAGLMILRADYRPYYFYLRAYYVDKNNHTLYYNPHCGYFSWQSRRFHNPILSAVWERDNNTIAYVVKEIAYDYRYQLVRYNSTSGFYYNVTYYSDLKYYSLTRSRDYTASYSSVSTKIAVLARSTDARVFEVNGSTVTSRMFQFSLPGLSVGYYSEDNDKLYLATTPNSDYEVFIVDVNPQTGSLGTTIDKFKPSLSSVTNVYVDDLVVTDQGNPLLAYRDRYRSRSWSGDYYYYINVRLFNKDPGDTRDHRVNLVHYHYQSYRITGAETIMGPVISPNRRFIAFAYASKPCDSYSPDTPLYHMLVVANLTELYTRDTTPVFALEYQFTLIDDYLMGPVVWSSNGSLLLVGLGKNVTVVDTSSPNTTEWRAVSNITLPCTRDHARIKGLAVFDQQGSEKLAVLLWYRNVDFNVEEGVNLYVIDLNSLAVESQLTVNDVFHNDDGSVDPILTVSGPYLIVIDKISKGIKYYDTQLNLVGAGSLDSVLQQAGEQRLTDVVVTDNGHTLYLIAGDSVVKARIPDPSALQQSSGEGGSSEGTGSQSGGQSGGGSGGGEEGGEQQGTGSQSGGEQGQGEEQGAQGGTQENNTQIGQETQQTVYVKLSPEERKVMKELAIAVKEIDEAVKPLVDLGNVTSETVVEALNEVNATQLMNECLETGVIKKVIKLDEQTKTSLREVLEDIYGPALINYPTEMGRFYLLYVLYYQQ